MTALHYFGEERDPMAPTEYQAGDVVRAVSALHGPLTGRVTRVTRWRHKVYYYVDWLAESGDRFASRERAGKDDRGWERTATDG